MGSVPTRLQGVKINRRSTAYGQKNDAGTIVAEEYAKGGDGVSYAMSTRYARGFGRESCTRCLTGVVAHDSQVLQTSQGRDLAQHPVVLRRLLQAHLLHCVVLAVQAVPRLKVPVQVCRCLRACVWIKVWCVSGGVYK